MNQIIVWTNKIVDKYGKVKTMVTFILLFLLVISFGYNDVIIINRQALSLWKSIFEYGNPFHFYDTSYYDTLIDKEIGKLAVSSMYDFTIYIIEGIWQLPLYIISLFSEVDIAISWYGILWGKLLHVICCFIDGYLVYCLAKLKLSEDRSIAASVYFFTSIVTCSSVYIIGQCDTIVLIFVLWGIICLLNDSPIQGTILFAIATSLKMFAIFPFMVFIFLYEKKISKLITHLVPVVLFVLIVKLIFRPFDEEAVAHRSGWLLNETKLMFDSKLPFMGGWIPIFTFLVVGTLCVCYLYKKKNKEYEGVIYFCFLIYFLIFLSFNLTPYWYIYLMPFYCIILSTLEEYREETFILAFIGEMSLVIAHYIRFYWCFDVQNVNRSLMGAVVGFASENTGFFRFSNFYELTNSMVFGSFYGIYVVCFTFIALLYFKYVIKKSNGELIMYESNKWWYDRRIAFRLLISFIPLAVFFANRLMLI